MGAKLYNVHDLSKSITPGPGHFNPSHDSVTKKTPGYSIKNQVKIPLTEVEKNPGPGSYISQNLKPKGIGIVRTGSRYIPGNDK